MSNYNYIKIDDNSYPSIQELYLRSYNLRTSVESIRNKYDTSFWGLKNVGYLAVDSDGDLAANYCVFPIKMIVDGKEYLVAQSGDTMTAPEHRKKNLFTILAKKTYQLSEENGIHFVYGFPNQFSFHGLKSSLGWDFYGRIKCFTIKNTTFPICEISVKFKALYPFYIKYCNFILKKHKIILSKENIEVFTDNILKGYVKKDIDFFKYKMTNKCVFLIKINGFTMLIKTDPHLIVGAVGKFDISRIDDFIKTLKSLSKKLGCWKTRLTFSENHWLYSFLLNKVEHTEGLPIGYYIINKDIPYENISFIGADYDTF